MERGALVFDIETHSADERYSRTPEDFFRIGGALEGGNYRSTTDVHSMRAGINRSPLLVGHNILNFDLPALGIDVIAATNERRVMDTMILDATLDPPDFGMKPAQAMSQKYSLERACARAGVPGKSGDLRALAREFAPAGANVNAGYGCIPTDDPRYTSYLEGDVHATAALFDVIGSDIPEYAWREMRIAAVCSPMSTVGFAVDRELLDERVTAGELQRAELISWLVQEFDIPTTLPDGKPSKAPVSTKAGKAAVVAAFESVGVTEDHLPRTLKGAVSLSGDGLEELSTRYPAAAPLCDAVAALVGIRSVYQTALTNLHPDGRVHPDVSMFQASGRASVTKPGLTVFGKRDGRKVERDIFVAAEGNVLLSADLSQVDARAVAAHSGDPKYIGLFAPGLDAHMTIAYLVWGEATVSTNPKYYRDTVKAITHGTTYGMGVPKLALGAGVAESEAYRVVNTLHEEFPGVEEWKREVRAEAEAGNMLDNGFGRLMRPNPERAWTQGPALIGQGTARDILMEGLLRMSPELATMIRAIVHDEVVIECAADVVEDVRQAVIDAMSFEWCPSWKEDPVMFVADCSPAPGAHRWSGCY